MAKITSKASLIIGTNVKLHIADKGGADIAITDNADGTVTIMEDWKITLPDGTQAMVPKLFVFTGASIPWFLRPFATAFGPLLRASLFHDYGYAKNFVLDWEGNKIFEGKGQKFFDDWFREIAAITSHLKGLAVSAWAGVRALGS